MSRPAPQNITDILDQALQGFEIPAGAQQRLAQTLSQAETQDVHSALTLDAHIHDPAPMPIRPPQRDLRAAGSDEQPLEG